MFILFTMKYILRVQILISILLNITFLAQKQSQRLISALQPSGVLLAESVPRWRIKNVEITTSLMIWNNIKIGTGKAGILNFKFTFLAWTI